MADIYLARRVGIGDFERLVALKVLGTERAEDAEALAMFLDEARLVAMLNHQNIASVLDVAIADGRHYLAMEYVHGADLREILAAAQRSGKPMPFEVSIAIVCAAAAGLDHAHRRCSPEGKPLRLVHRDVSLSNIMVGHDGCVKVVDFGIAQTEIASVHTLPGVVRGKASYMSPEQCLGDKVDHRTDVFALGIVLYELTTGARCFSAKTDFDRMLAVVKSEYIQPSDLVAHYPSELAAVVKKALASDPEKRYASAAAMIEALEGVLTARGWNGGTSTIQRLMYELFGNADDADNDPITVEVVEPTVTEPISVPSVPTVAEPTRPGRRIARGTASDCPAPDNDDERTRGRRPVRRPSTQRLAVA